MTMYLHTHYEIYIPFFSSWFLFDSVAFFYNSLKHIKLYIEKIAVNSSSEYIVAQ